MWESWEHLGPDMYIEARFKEPMFIDRVEVDTPHYQPDIRMILKGQAAGSTTITLARRASVDDFPAPPDFQKKVTAALRSMGYTYLVMASNERCYKPIATNPSAWGMTLVTKRGEFALFALE